MSHPETPGSDIAPDVAAEVLAVPLPSTPLVAPAPPAPPSVPTVSAEPAEPGAAPSVESRAAPRAEPGAAPRVESGAVPATDPGARSFGALLRLPEFRALWFADTVSVLGDQIMRVSVSFLVYVQTGSEVATAAVYALTFLPTLLGGIVLSGLADRFPRKTVMIVTDLARAALFGLAALPGIPLGVVAAMVVVAVMLGSAFRSAQTATLPDVLEGESYTTGLAFRSISLQSAQLLGYGVGGVIAGALGPRWGLVLDAVTFVISAVLLAARVQRRPVPPRVRTHEARWRDYGHGIGSGIGLIARNPKLRVLVGLALMSGFYVVPEGLAPPYAAEFGGGGIATGLLMAADPAGSAIGAWLLVKCVPHEVQRRWMALLAVAPGLVLMLCWLGLGLPGSLAVWAVAGLLSVFQIPASVEFVRLVPDNQRGVALGLVTSAMLTAQGLGVVIGGVVADFTSAVFAIGATGAAGVVAGLLLVVRWRGLSTERVTTGEVSSIG